MKVKPVYKTSLIEVYNGEALELLRALPSCSVDVVITDPPYSSGGMTRGDRVGANTSAKYQNSGTLSKYSNFSGDNRDQRSFTVWLSIWMDELRRVTKPGSVIACFSDWRQIPSVTDALQVGGLVWRGVVPWAKKSARPCIGRWTAQCEYLVWATNGPRKMEGPCLPGFYHVSSPANRIHLTEKPALLMEELVKIAFQPGSVILDPFMGSGSTLRAARDAGINSIGFEQCPEICAQACARLISDEKNANPKDS
jgi:site-specific DNA-methyltransferase (adenine-specific)